MSQLPEPDREQLRAKYPEIFERPAASRLATPAMLVAAFAVFVYGLVDLGFSPAFANDGPERITFGNLEPLVTLMQETPAARLQQILVERITGGTQLRELAWK